MKYGSVIILIFVVVSQMVAGCGLVPEKFVIKADLGQPTLQRIDRVNDTLRRGIGITPELRETIKELNNTLNTGIKGGFTPDTLARVDRSLRIMEDGLKIGLDNDTLNSLNQLVDTIDNAPDQWQTAINEILHTLEGTAGTVAGDMADQVERLMVDARNNIQEVGASMGGEFRCNMDFMGSRIGSTINEFVGKGLVATLRAILSGEKSQPVVPMPHVCSILPNPVELSRVGESLQFEEGVVKISGYDFVTGNLPVASVVISESEKIEMAPIVTFRSSSYLIVANLQGIDFSKVPEGARLEFYWSIVDDVTAVPLLLPLAAKPVPSFTVVRNEMKKGEPPLEVQFKNTSKDATSFLWRFGDGETSTEVNPTHLYTEAKSYTVSLTAYNERMEEATEIKESYIEVVKPPPGLEASLKAEPSEGPSPLLVQFTDTTTGDPTSWSWDFEDGTPLDTTQHPSHRYERSGKYNVTLTVSNDRYRDSATTQITIYQPMIARLESSQPLRGFAPLEVTFNDRSQGDIISWKLDFDDKTPAVEYPAPPKQAVKHRYEKFGTYTPTLIIQSAHPDEPPQTLTNNIVITIEKRLYPPGSIFIMDISYKDRTSEQKQNDATDTPFETDTGISVKDYECGVVGFSTTGGILVDGTVGELLVIGLVVKESTGTWWVHANLPTYPHYHESWTDVQVLCVDRDLVDTGTVKVISNFLVPGGNEPVDLDSGNVKLSEYPYCAIAGMRAGKGNLSEDGHRSVLFNIWLEKDEANNTWTVSADLTTDDNEEQWRLKIMCFKDEPALDLLKRRPFYIHENVPVPKDPPEVVGYRSDYDCRVASWKAERGNLDTYEEVGHRWSYEKIKPPLQLYVILREEDGAWYVIGDIATEDNDPEEWTVNVLCISREISTWHIYP